MRDFSRPCSAGRCGQGFSAAKYCKGAAVCLLFTELPKESSVSFDYQIDENRR